MARQQLLDFLKQNVSETFGRAERNFLKDAIFFEKCQAAEFAGGIDRQDPAAHGTNL